VVVVTEHVVLLGLMGSGKTSIGTRVARRLGLDFVDSDVELERRTGQTARQLLEAHGADEMHAREAEVTDDALAEQRPTVIGAPASFVLDPAQRERLRDQFVVWLRADPHWLTEKLKHSKSEHRPFIDQDPDVLVRQHEERKDLYADVASLIVDTTKRDKDEVADEIVSARSGR
jgi:shikimate kinase